MRSLVIGAALAALIAAPVHAQRLRGTLTDSSTREPVTGAVVTVSDSAGRFLARGIAGADGHFDVPRFPGSKLIHVVRIGYRPVDATVPAAEELLDLRMRAIASQLATVTTSGRRVCPGDDANSQALQLWEQARSGFLAAVVARDARPPNLRLRYFRVERDPMLRRVVDDTVWVKTIVGDQPFVAARSATAFASDGYMRERLGGDRDYYAPDEAVLLDEAFAGSHCLRAIAADAAHVGTSASDSSRSRRSATASSRYAAPCGSTPRRSISGRSTSTTRISSPSRMAAAAASSSSRCRAACR